MKRSVLIFVGGILFLAITSCSISLAATPTPIVFPTAFPLPSPTASLALQATAGPTGTLLLPSSTPATPTSTLPLQGPYAAIRIASNDVLNIRSSPGENNPVVGTFPPKATTIQRTGNMAILGDGEWVQVQNPSGGIGWVNARYLTEYVPSTTFCADNRVNILLNNLAHALTVADGEQLASLVSPAHGMDVRLYRNGMVANYDPAHARFVFESTYAIDWGPAPGSGLETVGPFHGSVLPGLQEVFNASYTLDCDMVQTGGASYDTSWPEEYANINFYSVYKPGPSGQELNWRTVLVGVEYVQGQPTVFSLTQMSWEP